MELEKQKLIQEYFNDDNIDMQRIVTDYTNYVFTIIQNITKDILYSEDIEEIISDIFFAIWKSRERLDRNLPLKPYIAGVSKNVIKNRIRNINLEAYQELNEESDVQLNYNIEEITENKEKMEIIYEQLLKNDEDRQIFILFYSKNLKCREIASIMNLTEFNVNTKLHRIRKKMKKALEDRGYVYGK